MIEKGGTKISYKEYFNSELEKRLENDKEYQALKLKYDKYRNAKEYQIWQIMGIICGLIGIIGGLYLFYVIIFIRSNTDIFILIVPVFLLFGGYILMLFSESIQSSKYPEFKKMKRILKTKHMDIKREMREKLESLDYYKS